MIQLPTTVTFTPKDQLKGVTATLVERTPYSALYRRDDDYWECFEVTPQKSIVWVDGKPTTTDEMREYYPNIEAFGKTAWCGKENKIRTIYNNIYDSTKTSTPIS